jgi:hypothetical protein
LKDNEYQSGTMARIVTKDFPLYFAVVSRPRINSAIIATGGGVVSSKVVPQVQAVFPPDAVARNTKVGLQVTFFFYLYPAQHVEQSQDAWRLNI